MSLQTLHTPSTLCSELFHHWNSPYFLKFNFYFISGYSWFTMLCWFQVYSKVVQLYTHVYDLGLTYTYCEWVSESHIYVYLSGIDIYILWVSEWKSHICISIWDWHIHTVSEWVKVTYMYIYLGLTYTYYEWVSESHSVVSDSLQPHGLYGPSNSLGQNIGACSLSLLQGIFPTQGLNPGLPHCRQILY